MPERSLMGIVARTAYWVEWWRRLGPPSGNEPKLTDPLGFDLMRVAVSVREGTISSSTLLKRLRSGSRKNATYAAFREVGRVIRTVQPLRYLSDAPLRRRVTAASTAPTNSASSPRRTTRNSTSTSPRCASRT